MRRMFLMSIIGIIVLGLLAVPAFTPQQVLAQKQDPGANATEESKILSMETTNLYLVKEDDTLENIALRYGVNAETLGELNSLSDGLIKPDQYLFLPGVPRVVPWDKLSTDIKAQPLALPSSIEGQEIMLVVDKSDRTLSVFAGVTLLKSYHVSLGDGGLKDKNVAGDHRTPEGRFYVSEKLVLDPPDHFLGTRWLRLSYPMPEDAKRGLENGLIDENIYQEIITQASNQGMTPQRTPLGGGVGIHGGTVPEFEPDWTYGCVGLTNADVEEFYDLVQVGTPAVIVP